MTIDRAIEILTPAKTRYTPAEYEEALQMARHALRLARADEYMTLTVKKEEARADGREV